MTLWEDAFPGPRFPCERSILIKPGKSVANDEGAFRISELAPGVYEVLVNQAGFSPYQHAGVALQLGVTVHLEIGLQSAGVASQVTVTAQPPPIDPAQTSVTTAVDTERIEELPVESRN